MTAMQFPLSNVITISASQTPTGVSAFNTSNLALFTTDTPSPSYVYKMYFSPAAVATDYGTDTTTYEMALAVFSQQPNILLPGGYLVIIPFEVSETLVAAIARTSLIVQYFGIMSTQIESQTDTLAAAAAIQAMNAIGFFVQYNPTAVEDGGVFPLLTSGLYTQSRALFYDDSSSAGINALTMQAAYAGRALSTVFTGSNTVQNMNLKQLATVDPDPNITQTYLTDAQTAGADVYISLQGFSCILSSGANDFFDEVYNLQAFSGALQVAGFNFLASSTTSVPQTEVGMNGLIGAYQAVCDQFVTNGYLAAGTWNSPSTFGNQTNFYNNIAQYGYYIYSTPIALQSESARANRQAPLVQIAAKLAGAINTSTVIVTINP